MDFHKTSRSLLLIVAMSLSAMLQAQKIEATVDHDYDFGKAKTYALAPLSKTDTLNKYPEIEYTVRTELSAQLPKVGLKESKEHPDLLVSYTASQTESRNTYGTSQTGVTSGNQSWTDDYMIRTVSVTFFDPKTNQSVWQATATERTSGGTMEKYVPKLVKKLMDAYREDAQQKKKGKTW